MFRLRRPGRSMALLSTILTLGLGRAASAGARHPADDPVYHQAGNWVGACDNLQQCRLFGFSADDSATLILSLPPPPAAPSATVLLRPAHPLRNQPVRIQPPHRAAPLLLRPVADGIGIWRAPIDAAGTRLLLGSLRGGGALILMRGQIELGSIRLDRSGPVLDWLERARHHMPAPSSLPDPADTAPGPPPGTVPAAAPNMVLALPATIACLRQDATGPDGGPDGGITGYALSASDQLWQIPCGSGNFDRSSLFVLVDRGRAGIVTLAQPPQAPIRRPGILINAELGDDGRTLAATEPLRGLGDCGDTRRYRWDGTMFRLTLARLMTACHGLPPEDWPTIYRAAEVSPP